MEKQGDEIKAYCNVCAGERDHEVLFAVMREWHEDDYSWDEFEQCLLAACCGCKHRIFLTRNWLNSPDVQITQYPPKTVRKKPDWHFNLFMGNTADSTKNELITEIYAALGANCTRLAVLGIRALVEHIMVEKIGDQGSFENNLAAFEASGFISLVQKSAMSPVIQAGHASMHRAYNPPLDDVMHCLDVTENLILAIYIHPNRSAQMSIPERVKAAKKVKAQS